MRPSHFTGAGMPNKLPDRKPFVNKEGVTMGKTLSFPKVLRSLLQHQAEELHRRMRER
ncbi:Uncharacterised protein [Mycobacteroides abscessus subsp. massiliense]|nr:Uncharacterised protein [Mycobacteroides abscessus subsp. massiliense]